MASNRIEIQAGTDVSTVFRMRNRKSGDPIDLTAMTAIRIIMTDRNRNQLIYQNVTIPSKAASFVYQNVTYTAVTPGANSNLIMLTFDGTSTIAQIITLWNQAHTMNQVMSNAVDPSVIPTAGQIMLAGGFDSYAQIAVFGDPKLGKVQLILKQQDTLNLKIGNNQSIKFFLDFGPGGPRSSATYQSKFDVLD